MKSRTELALEVAMAALKSHSSYLGNCALTEIDAILHPVEVEEQEVERFLVFYADGSVSHALTREGINGFDCKGGTVKRVAHTIRREKKVVERRVCGLVTWERHAGCDMIPLKAGEPSIPWEDICGKTGLLTFEWPE
jgi:hypothetical protein